MKWLVASDLHGSAVYGEALLKAVEREAPDKVLLLGDLLYHGPRNDLPHGYQPKKVIEQLSSLDGRVLCVRGNCDSEVDQMVLPFEIMTPTMMLFVDGQLIFASHGHHYTPENPPHISERFVLLGGHTHVAGFEEREGFVYINPGSLSIPKENTPHSYLLEENGLWTWKTTNGDVFLQYNR